MTTSSRKVLVVAAHPDDEVLGCGATIANHSERGDQVSVLIMAEGATSRLSKRERSVVMTELTELNSAAQMANSILGVKRLNLLGFPDNRMDSVDLLDVIKVVETEINEWQPDIVYTHHVGDVNIDHRVIHDAVIAATRPLPGRKLQTVLFFEIASSTEWRPAASAYPFSPNWFVDITSHWQKKKLALEAYASEMRSYPHPRSLEAVEYLAKWRGVSVGYHYAEAFMLGRHILGA